MAEDIEDPDDGLPALASTGRCVGCDHALLPDQRRCPECGLRVSRWPLPLPALAAALAWCGAGCGAAAGCALAMHVLDRDRWYADALQGWTILFMTFGAVGATLAVGGFLLLPSWRRGELLGAMLLLGLVGAIVLF